MGFSKEVGKTAKMVGKIFLMVLVSSVLSFQPGTQMCSPVAFYFVPTFDLPSCSERRFPLNFRLPRRVSRLVTASGMALQQPTYSTDVLWAAYCVWDWRIG